MKQCLQVAQALMDFSRALASDRSLEHEYYPGMEPKNWEATQQAHQELLDLMKAPKPRSWGIHVSEVTKGPGWHCDLWIWYSLLAEKEPVTLWDAGSIRNFWIGDALHQWLLPRVVPALLYKYRERLEIVDVRIEWGVVSGLLTGHADLYLSYILDGVPASVVIDLKSTSESMHNKRVRKKAKLSSPQRIREVEAEPHYRRQLATYVDLLDADYGLLVYWIKQFPHEMEQVHVPLSLRLLGTIRKRIDGNAYGSSAPAATRGAHCTECPFFNQCEADHAQ